MKHIFEVVINADEADGASVEELMAALSDMVNAPMRLANNDTLYLDGCSVDYLGSKNE